MRTAAICPTCATYTNAVCVVYDGPYLSNLDINPLTSLSDALEQINFIVSGLEKIANKSTNIIADQASNIKYPSVKAVYTWGNATFQPALGFTPENVANKSTNTALGTSDTLYPTQKAVKTYVDAAISAVPVPNLQQVTDQGTVTNNSINVVRIDNTKSNVNIYPGGAFGTLEGSLEVTDNRYYANFYKNRVEYFDDSTGWVLNLLVPALNTANYDLTYPKASGVFAVSVNGNTANANGAITVPDPYKVYVATVSMVDGSANVLKNTLGATLNWSTFAGGVLASSTLLIGEPTIAFVTSNSNIPKIVSVGITNNSVIWEVAVFQTDNAGAPNSTGSVFVEIRIYA
jgi:hypothetical protein